jgi:hypothetical protein
MKTALYKMIITYYGSPDGITVDKFEEGQTYQLPEKLGDLFVESEVAIKREEQPKSPGRPKKVDSAPKNKMSEVPSNKYAKPTKSFRKGK